MSGDEHSLRNITIKSTLVSLIYIEPLNLFLYTWRFLSQLELEEENMFLKRMYRFYAPISVVLLSLSLISITTAGIFEGSGCLFFIVHGEKVQAAPYCNKTESFVKSVNIIGAMTNLMSCTILGLVMRLLHKRTTCVLIGRESMDH